MFEFLFELIGELVLQALFEALAELGLQSTREVFKRPPNPALATLGYAIYGAGAGGLSLILHAAHFTHSPTARLAALIFVPIGSGLAMSLLGAWRRKQNQDLIRLDRFAYGYVFALAMALVRFFWAQ
jgi:hypothetical protein